MRYSFLVAALSIATLLTCPSIEKVGAQPNSAMGANFWLAEADSSDEQITSNSANFVSVQDDSSSIAQRGFAQPASCDVCCDLGGSGCCDTCCDTCCDPCCCCPPWWAHRNSVFGEYLYLQPADADVTHAQQQNGIGGAGTVPFGQIGVASLDYEPGFRAGGSLCLSNCSSLFGSYTYFESSEYDTLLPPVIPGGGGAVGSFVHHPGASITASVGPMNSAYDIDFQLAEFGIRRVWRSGASQVINWSVGGRYGHLEQDFLQSGVFSGGSAGQIDTRTEIDFDGGGLIFGLDGERRCGCSGLSLYGKINVSPMTGRFHADYSMQNVSTEVLLALADWQDDRITTLLDYEAGLAFTCGNCDCFRISAGYTVYQWFNAVTTDSFINGVKADNYEDISGPLSFSGLVTRAEFRW
ncbi:Lpg1974 family pore-forming outer membrane protein [Bythopirellula polymerisocia]|uniref:Uncharacterized protein n=1 Tax=Bythopirellula polymerisocia TaxID=2528003 RepID=A0A5C6CME9_9BACT|nr:Lpg1974 family pore-forming outer membrane protein [Bythopirellula polymerisocia]TWU24501.1 hypothetical protein Pla144_33850 [Bythopirellula polymerisocia]